MRVCLYGKRRSIAHLNFSNWIAMHKRGVFDSNLTPQFHNHHFFYCHPLINFQLSEIVNIFLLILFIFVVSRMMMNECNFCSKKSLERMSEDGWPIVKDFFLHNNRWGHVQYKHIIYNIIIFSHLCSIISSSRRLAGVITFKYDAIILYE